jgi:hypothetical protein
MEPRDLEGLEISAPGILIAVHRIPARIAVGVAALLSFCLHLSRVQAQDPRPEMRAHRLLEGETIAIDGVPDELPWQKAAPATDFRQRDPENGAPATENTEVRVIFDENRIILGITCFDSEPERLLGNQLQRDQSFEADDRFMLSIDPFHDGRTGYFFEINPSGAMGDGLITSPTGGGGDFGGEMNKSWDGIWLARVRRSAIGWTAEVEIPFKTLNFDPGAAAWGANFQRTVKRKNEESLWTGWLRDEGLTRMSNAGRIAGIRDISQGIGLDLKPYVLGAGGNAPGRGVPDTSGDFDIGLDAFYNVTPSLKANVTVNTDFAETEVDERRTNLTRFPLFFEEKREFFLDGANFFEFPGGDESPFFSRRIGLNNGAPQPILYGGKLIGQLGAHDLGVLQIRTGEQELASGDPLTLRGEDFTVARVRRRFGSQSSVGALYTRRATRDSIVDDRHTIGTDLTLATPDFVGGTTLDSGAWFVHTTTPRFLTEDGEASPDGGADSYGLDASVSRDPYRAAVSFKEVQAAYNPAVGFTPRRDVRQWNPEVEWAPRLSNHPLIRGFQSGAEADVNLNLQNQLVDRNIQLTPIQVEFHSGDSVEFQLFKQSENLDENFEISDGIVLPAGASYDWLRYQFVYDSAEQRMMSGRVEFSWGPFWDGDRRELNLDLNLRPRTGLLIQLSSEHNDVDLPAGSFSTQVWQADVRTQVNPWISLSNNVQYDSESRQVGWQLRFRWIQKPGNDTFFIWTQNWLDPSPQGTFAAAGSDSRLKVLDRRGAAKIVRTIRF